MAALSFWVFGKKNPSQIYLRLIHGAKLDVFVRTGVLINPEHWDKKRRRVRNLAEATQKDFINSSLESLSGYLLNQMNIDYVNGVSIDKSWVGKTIKKFFNQYNEEDMLFADYCQKYIEKAPKLLRKGSAKTISIETVKKYKSTLQKIKNFETYSGNRLRFKDLDIRFHEKFLNYLKEEEKLGLKTIGKYIKIIRFFAGNAKLEGYSVSDEINCTHFFAPNSETKSVYLNDEEINKIFALDLSSSERLENARDNAIVGLRTGLRVSDFLQLELDHIKGDYIEVKTKKTGQNVIIPLHAQVKRILEKRGGLPRRISDQKFNVYFKEICQLAGIAEETEGARMNPDTKRKEEGFFPKYQLVSSHTCRRSFATNLYGKLPSLSIMAITGHKSEKQFLEYIKITPREHAEKLKELWDKIDLG